MTLTRGKHHVFLRIDITFNNNRTVTLLMKEYLKEAIADSGMDAWDKARISCDVSRLLSFDKFDL